MRILGVFLAALVGLTAFADKPVVIVTDCGNWVDDQLAILQLLASTEVTVKGIIATQYGAPDTNKQAFDSVKSLLKSVGSTVPVWLGAGGSLTGDAPIESDGAKKLVELSQGGTLNVLCIAAATDVASAIKMSPSSAKNLQVTWVGGGPLPKGGRGDFNLANDLEAARVLFNSPVGLIWIPAAGGADGIKLTGKEIREKFGGMGKAGSVIASIVANYDSKPLTLWDLSAAGIFLRPGFGTTESMPAPDLNEDYNIIPRRNTKSVVVYTKIRSDAVVAEFGRSVQLWSKGLGPSSSGG